MKTKIIFAIIAVQTALLIYLSSIGNTSLEELYPIVIIFFVCVKGYYRISNLKKLKVIELLTDALKQSEVDIIQLNREISGYKEQITALTRKRDSSGKYVGKVKSVKKLEPFKIRVTPEESRVVQEVLFENGYEWGLNGRNVVNTEQPFLLIDMDDDLICYMKDGCDNQFCNLREPEITFSQFKSIYKIK